MKDAITRWSCRTVKDDITRWSCDACGHTVIKNERPFGWTVIFARSDFEPQGKEFHFCGCIRGDRIQDANQIQDAIGALENLRANGWKW